jgi:hypothetical protein
MGESFADLRKAFREVAQSRPAVIERKRGGAVPAQAKIVGPVIRGAAAEREMQRMEKQAAAGKSSNAQKRYANGGAVPNYLFATPGSSLTAPAGTPGGAGLIPAMRFNRNSFQTAPKGFGAPNPNPNHGNAVDAAKQIQTTIGDASKWVTPSNSATPAAATSAVDDPNGIGGLYARGGVVRPARGAKRVSGKGRGTAGVKE